MRFSRCVLLDVCLIFALWLVIGVMPAFAFTYSLPSEDELVKQSDVGVIGKLTDIRQRAGWGKVYSEGLIQVDEVLFGGVNGKGGIPTRWIEYPGHPVPSELGAFEGEQRIWLLEENSDGTYTGRWTRVLRVSEKGALLSNVDQPLRVKWVEDFTTTDLVFLVYRNFTDSPREMPVAERGDGNELILPAGTFLTVELDGGRLLEIGGMAAAKLAGSVTVTTAPRMLTLKPGEEHRVPLTVTEVFPMLREDTYNLRWRMDGVGESNEVYIWPLNEDTGSDDDYPLWLKLRILLTFSPAREAVMGGVLAVAALVWGVRRWRGLRVAA